MKLVKQHKSSCVLAAVFMLNDNKDYKQIKRFCKKKLGYSATRRTGCTVNADEPVDLLRELGLSAYAIDGGTRFATICGVARFNRALVLASSNGETGHALAWDGYKFYDPYGPRIMTEQEFTKAYGNCNMFYIAVIKIGYHRRLANIGKKLWSDIKYIGQKL